MSRLALFASFACVSIVNYSFGLAVAWLLTPGDFGLVAFAQTVLLIAGIVLESGIPWALSRGLARATEVERESLVRGAVAANTGLGALLGVLILILWVLGPLQSGFEAPGVVCLVALALPFIGLVCAAKGASQGIQRFGVLALLQSVEIVGKALVGVVLILLGLRATGAIAGATVGAVVSAGFGSVWLYHTFASRSGVAIRLPSIADTGPILAGLIGLALLLNLDLLTVKLLAVGADRSIVGFYQASIVLANTPYYLVAAVVVPVLFSQVARASTITDRRRIVIKALALVSTLVIPIELILAIDPASALGVLFPAGYAQGAQPLRLLAVSRAISTLVVVLSASMQASGYARVPMVVFLTASTAEMLLLPAAFSAGQMTGTAAMSVIASAGALYGIVWCSAPLIGRPSVARLAKWLGRYSVALAVASVVGAGCHAVGIGSVVSLGLGAAFYLLAVLVLRLVPGSSWLLAVVGCTNGSDWFKRDGVKNANPAPRI